MYRSYGKQDAIRKQSEAFGSSIEVERRWLNYNAQFRALSNWVKNSGAPYGNTILRDGNGKESQELNIGGGGGGDINLNKMFLEQAHALLGNEGRMGFIVPSGIYSDHGTGTLRTLFLDRCRWEWVFGFENREGIFDIHRSFKFNPMIIQKGGVTDRIQTAFMRRDLRDWEQAEKHVTEYPRERVLQFSPRSKAILEIQSQRDLEVLEKIYSNGVLLGDQSPNGWGIKYSTEFHMTNDSKLFPPRDKWEERGYRPDEYSRWLRGKWRSIQELYAELGVKPLAEGEVRDVQPQYSHLPIPRADIPEGGILSRDGQSYLLETEIDTDEFLDKRGDPITGPAIALPLYEGRMVGQFDFSQKGWVSGKGRSAVWREVPWENKQIEPQYLMAEWTYQNIRFEAYIDAIRSKHGEATANQERSRLDDPPEFMLWWINQQSRVAFMDVTSATNERTMIAAPGLRVPYGNSAQLFATSQPNLALCTILSSFIFDFMARFRCGGLHLNYFVVDETALPQLDDSQIEQLTAIGRRLIGNHNLFAIDDTNLAIQQQIKVALTEHERLRWTAIQNVVVAMLYGLEPDDIKWIFKQCDLTVDSLRSNDYTRTLPLKGFWRTQRTNPPSERVTVLTQIAFENCWSMGGTCDDRLSGFLNQNDREGWQIPEEIDLGEYGLGEGSGGRVAVRSRFGPRYFGWQENQGVEESWRECHLHARNLLGPSGYASLLAELRSPGTRDPGPQSPHPDGLSAAVPSVPPASEPTANGPPASVSGQSAKKPARMGESSTPSGSPSSSRTSPTGVSNASPLGDSPPFDPDTFTLSNDPVPKKRKKR